MTAPVRPTFSDHDLAELSQSFEAADASHIIQWATDQFAPHLSLTASMTDAVLIDLATKIHPAIEVVFIDTGYHFPETLETVEVVRRHYGLNLRIMTVKPHAEKLWIVDPQNCCSAVKVGQLDRALDGKLAWMSGLRRAESELRAGTPIVMRDLRGLVKVNPIANWSDEQVADYIAANNVPYNPLLDRGYLSIGCQPCTQPVDGMAGVAAGVGAGTHSRAGRWAGRDKTECGMHV